MQTGHVQQSRHGKTIREQPVHVGFVGSLEVWHPYSLLSLLQNWLQSSAPIWQHTKMIQDNTAMNCKPENHICHLNSGLWRCFLPNDLWRRYETLRSSPANNLQPKSCRETRPTRKTIMLSLYWYLFKLKRQCICVIKSCCSAAFNDQTKKKNYARLQCSICCFLQC